MLFIAKNYVKLDCHFEHKSVSG